MFRPAIWLYGRINDIRNSLYDRGIFRSHSLGARTISVGNITMGGTGKTPLVAYVAEILSDAGQNVCVLTRGYGRETRGRVLVSDGEQVLADARAAGDEPVELAQKLLGKSIVVADADRVSAAAWALTKFPITAFVLDDAFQHRRAKRDLDIVCVDATNPFGKILREPKKNLRRAGAIVITRSDLVPRTEPLLNDLRALAPEVPIFKALSKLKSLDHAKNVLPFCGIGNPEAFFAMLANAGYSMPAKRVFPDHHRYSQSDVDKIVSEARSAGCEILITTAKDAAKLKSVHFEIPLTVAEIDVVIEDDEEFRKLLTS
jgi:tetraacyldisaccharide 4'-kinase